MCVYVCVCVCTYKSTQLLTEIDERNQVFQKFFKRSYVSKNKYITSDIYLSFIIYSSDNIQALTCLFSSFAVSSILKAHILILKHLINFVDNCMCVK